MLEIDTEIWGSQVWYIMHYLSNNLNEDHINDYYNFFDSLRYIIPCPVCKKHYSKLLTTYKMDFNNKEECSDWVYNIHNFVNIRINNNVYNKTVLQNYNSTIKFNKYVYQISNILVYHDIKSFSKIKYFYKIVCLNDPKLDDLYKTIPRLFSFNNKTLTWLNDFNKKILL